MKNIFAYEVNSKSINENPVEYVERKGLGHPDSLIDGIVESMSRELIKIYKKEFGGILHYNVDKGLIVGGSSKVTFGVGKITKPIEIIIAGRATDQVNNKKIPIKEIVDDVIKKYLKENTRFLDIDNEIITSSKILPGSQDLNQIFKRSDSIPLANDTSFGIGFAPFTTAELLPLKIENFLNSKEYKNKMPMVGEDIKVMCIRKNNTYKINVAIAFVAKFISNIEEYVSTKEKVKLDILKLINNITKDEVMVEINSGDNIKNNEIYLTKSGLSCESGDDGQVGRGNRINGLITPFRTMTMEAAAGKNPVNHPGKIYSVLSNEIAKAIVDEYNQIDNCTVAIVSYIGEPINNPKNLTINVHMKKGEKLESIKSKIITIAENKLDNIEEITDGFIEGKYKIF
ncbi:MAG: methionine adenosyltransferase [Candidatus Micrarchaeia archaeon]